jgi:predicted aldo/keto reductase-like oxidoreductase
VRVSPLCLGAMNFGDAWSDMMGKCDKKTVFEILDFFYDQGGNFIDTYVSHIQLGSPQQAFSGLTRPAEPTITRTKSRRRGLASG